MVLYLSLTVSNNCLLFLEYAFNLSWQLLLAYKPIKAEKSLQTLLKLDPENTLGKLLLGLSLLLQQRESEEAELNLREGVFSSEAVKFVGILATALLRRGGLETEAERVYEAGFRHGLFMSKWQRSASDSQFHLR